MTTTQPVSLSEEAALDMYKTLVALRTQFLADDLKGNLSEASRRAARALVVAALAKAEGRTP